MDIIKTFESWRKRADLLKFFDVPDGHVLSFSLGRGKPKIEPRRLWFVHCGRLFGWLSVEGLEQRGLEEISDGEFTYTLDDACSQPRTWKPRLGTWMVVCVPPLRVVVECIFHEGFRGWRYFDFQKHCEGIASKIWI